MNLISGIVLYIILWWVVFFTTLPFGIKTSEEAGVELEPGMATSAPVKPMLGLKLFAATLITAVLWGVIYYVVVNEVIVLDDLLSLLPSQP